MPIKGIIIRKNMDRDVLAFLDDIFNPAGTPLVFHLNQPPYHIFYKGCAIGVPLGIAVFKEGVKLFS